MGVQQGHLTADPGNTTKKLNAYFVDEYILRIVILCVDFTNANILKSLLNEERKEKKRKDKIRKEEKRKE